MSCDVTGKGKLFGVGFPKTGTTSLEVALMELGYNVCRGNGKNTHSNYLMALCVHRDFTELERVIRHFDAFADLPWGGSDLYLWLAQRYPEARFLLTMRDPEAWYDSVLGSALKHSANLDETLDAYHKTGRFGAVLFVNRVWGIYSLDNAKDKLIDFYLRTNQAIVDHFAGTDRLLIIPLTENPSWDGLCTFLGKPVPDSPFPRENARAPSAKVRPAPVQG